MGWFSSQEIGLAPFRWWFSSHLPVKNPGKKRPPRVAPILPDGHFFHPGKPIDFSPTRASEIGQLAGGPGGPGGELQPPGAGHGAGHGGAPPFSGANGARGMGGGQGRAGKVPRFFGEGNPRPK